jgi:Tfp pilus assembly protein PilE
MKKSFSLIELLVVVVIIDIQVTSGKYLNNIINLK